MIPTNKYTESFNHYIKGTNNTHVCMYVCVCVCVCEVALVIFDSLRPYGL